MGAGRGGQDEGNRCLPVMTHVEAWRSTVKQIACKKKFFKGNFQLLKNSPFISRTIEEIHHFVSLIFILPFSSNEATDFLICGKTDFLSWLLVIIS